jgi:hypothetical protein
MIRIRAELRSTQALSAAFMAESLALATPARRADNNKHNSSERTQSNVITKNQDRNLFDKHIWEKVCAVHKIYEDPLITSNFGHLLISDI